ncbi:phage tail tape measure protein [Bacillus cytotoxicus]|uniref:phage tail tape measure protein n=1 Tax=Bacillus cytotoxicus TaxID=580165 RepID=UPI000B363DE6|nr:phage tail tape measure protein [Bacillus cytotoxicus]AWC39543.1 phage tail tape measure protein [Bacillus cytotoxicus]AWC47474.1 phage tail tape measure protein [Bacillus cytotoxicus]AWC53142.1 phage tail tape measure protein [Bacillus cytotoxicus]AWC57271.1 phage tail tape measure protein [Bacillus cytotoxicus]
MQNGFKHITRTLREFQQAASQPINIPTPNMSGWNSAMQSASQQVRQMNDRMRNMTPPPPPNMNGWNSTFRNVGNRVQEMGHRVQQAGQTAQNAFAPAAAASGFFLGKMINDAREFESQTRRAAVLTGGSYNQVKSDILDMAKTSVYSTREVAAAYSEMGAKGFDAAQSTAALPGVLSAAAASGEDLGLVADTITSALNAFGMEANKSGKVADILAQSANQSAASVLDLNYAFKYAAGPANALGISMEELAASIGIMVDAGSTGESAGTALRASMLRLVKPPKEAADALKKLGVTTTDSNGKMKPLAQLMGELQKGMEGYTDSQKASTMAAIFGTEAVSGMLNLMGAGPEKIREMTKALKNSSGASKQAADDMLKGWAGALKMMESAIDANSKTFVDALGPAIEAVANSITNLVNWFANLSGTMRSVVAISAVSVTGFLVIATVVGMMASAIGTALIPLGKFIGWLGKSTTAAKLASAAMVGLRAAFAFLTGPVGIVIAALALIGVAILQLYKHNETFRNGVNSAWESVKSVTVSAVETMKSAFDAFCAYLSTIPAKFSEMGVAIGGFVDSIKEKFSGIGENISAAFGSTIESLSAKFAGISSALSPVVEFIKSSFASISNTIATLTPLVVRLGLSFLGISGPVGWVIAIIASLGATLFKLINSNEQAKAALTSAWQMIQNVISTVAATLMPILTSIAQGFIDAFAPLAPEFEKTGQVIAESLATLGPVLAELGAAFGELGTTIASLFGEVVQAVMPLALELIQLFADTTIEIMPVITEAIQQVAQIFTEFAATYLPMFVQAFQQGFPIVLQVIQTVFEIAGMLIQGFGEIIMIVATTVIPMILSSVQAVFPIIVSIIQAAIPIVISVLQMFGEIIRVIATTVIPLILQVVQAVFPVVVSIIQAAIPVASAILQGIATIIKGVVIPAIQFILSIVQAVFPSVVSVITSAINIITNIIKLFTSLLKGDWSGAWNAVKGITSSAMSLIRSIIQGAISLISSIVTAGLNLVRSVFSSVLSAVSSLVSSIFSGIRSVISSVMSSIGSIVSSIWNSIKSMTSSVLSSVYSTVTSIFNNVKSFLSGIDLGSIGRNMMQGLLNGISSMASAIWDKITDIGNGIKDKISGLLSIHSPSRWFRDFIGVNMMKGWINGIDAMKGAVQKTTERMAEWMKPEALTVETVYGMPEGLGTYRTAKTTPIIDAVNKSNLQPGQSSNSKQPAYINVQIGKQEFVRFVDDITNEQKIAKERRAIF